MRNILLAVTALTACAVAAPAAALVQYDFTAYSSFPIEGEQFSGSFSYTAPDFIVPDTTVDVADLTSCEAFSNLGPVTCREQGFISGLVDDMVTVSFGVNAVGGTYGIFYYFVDTAFGTPGTYESTLFGTDQQGQLVVTDLGVVPEPASWAMMIAGFGLVGGAMRRRVARIA